MEWKRLSVNRIETILKIAVLARHEQLEIILHLSELFSCFFEQLNQLFFPSFWKNQLLPTADQLMLCFLILPLHLAFTQWLSNTNLTLPFLPLILWVTIFPLQYLSQLINLSQKILFLFRQNHFLLQGNLFNQRRHFARFWHKFFGRRGLTNRKFLDLWFFIRRVLKCRLTKQYRGIKIEALLRVSLQVFVSE